jgi:hypothetical protein
LEGWRREIEKGRERERDSERARERERGEGEGTRKIFHLYHTFVVSVIEQVQQCVWVLFIIY